MTGVISTNIFPGTIPSLPAGKQIKIQLIPLIKYYLQHHYVFDSWEERDALRSSHEEWFSANDSLTSTYRYLLQGKHNNLTVRQKGENDALYFHKLQLEKKKVHTAAATRWVKSNHTLNVFIYNYVLMGFFCLHNTLFAD